MAALYVMCYNLAPDAARDASDAGRLSNPVWSIEEIVSLIGN